MRPPPASGLPDDGFGGLADVPADALLGLIALYRADPRPHKIDLGVGVFRDDQGRTPVMRSVKAAEAQLVATQPSKAYLGAEGDPRYTELLAEIVFGKDLAGSSRLTGFQTPGGTGALRLGAELIRRALPNSTIWIGEPTWPNHGPIFREAGLRVTSHRFYDVSAAKVDYEAMCAELEAAQSGDVLLLHGCCHNPSGVDFDHDQWKTIAALCERKGVIPFLDLAYQGLGDGLDADAHAARLVFRALPTAILAYSCDKNFGLYRDRVGALWVQGRSAASMPVLRSNILALARSLWSMPPDHGAAIVRMILETDAMRRDWKAELDAMRQRIRSLRGTVADAIPALGFMRDQRGMFSMLPASPDVVTALREDHAIYMAGNGRINIAGLNQANIPYLAAALKPYL